MAATFILTLDTELAWGTFYWKGYEYYKYHFDNYRRLVRRLIDQLEYYNISATWAFVGHLFLDKCDGIHADVLRPRYKWFNGDDWHKYDPGTDLDSDPYWYGADVLELVRSMNVQQEIGTHTFSHVHMADPECTPDIARSQIESCVKLGREHGLEIKSLVFPRDEVGHLDVFSALGIESYRGVEEVWYVSLSGLPRRVCSVLDQLLAISPPVYKLHDLKVEHGLVNIPGSNFLFAFDRYHKFIPAASRVAKIKKGIRLAIEENAIYHLAFHPEHLGSSEKMFEVFDDVFKYLDEYRRAGLIEVKTMSDICDEYWRQRRN